MQGVNGGARPRLNSRGFTLIELIVVMALIALTVSFAVPQIADFLYADQLKATVRKLVGLIHQSSRLAQREQTAYLLTYSETERLFVVESERKAEKTQGRTEPTKLSLHLNDSVQVGDFWSWYGGQRSGADRVVRFSKEGYVEPTILYLRKDDGREMSVVLSPFLGKVQIIDSHVAPDKDAFAR